MGSDQGQELSAGTEKQPRAQVNSDSTNLRHVRGTIPAAALIVVCLSFFERLSFNAVTSPLREFTMRIYIVRYKHTSTNQR